MPFFVPSLSKFRSFLTALGRAILPTKNWEPESFYGRFATFLSGGTTQLHAHVSSAERDCHPLTAGDGAIDRWGAVMDTERKDATPARRLASGRVRGSAGATVASGTQLTNPNTGLIYQINNPSAITIPGVIGVDPDSFFDADIIAISLGSKTRMIEGDTLQFLSAPPGIESEVVMQLDLNEDGFDVEPFGPYRERVLDQFREPPAGGNQADYVKWAKKALPAVRYAFAYPNRDGRGSMDVAAFYAGNGASRSLTPQDKAAVADYIRTKAPFHIAASGGPLRMLDTIDDQQRIEVMVEPNGMASFEFDWPAPPGGVEVLDYDSSNRELQFVGGTIPAGMRAGHRIILDGTVAGSGVLAQDGREYKVEALVPPDKVILEKSPPTPPLAGDFVYSGGKLVKPIRDAILGHVNGEIVYAGRGQVPLPESAIGPTGVATGGQSIVNLDILAEGMGSANPKGRYNGPTVRWSGGLLRSTLFKIAMFKAGVRNVEIVSPATDYEATDDKFPTNDRIHFIAPAVVIVRRYTP